MTTNEQDMVARAERALQDLGTADKEKRYCAPKTDATVDLREWKGLPMARYLNAGVYINRAFSDFSEAAPDLVRELVAEVREWEEDSARQIEEGIARDNKIVDALLSLRIDSMSPMECMTALKELQRKAGEQ